MTALTKAVRRSAGDIVITLAPEGVYTRERRRHTWFGPLPLAALHQLLVQRTVDARVRLAKARVTRRVNRGLIASSRRSS